MHQTRCALHELFRFSNPRISFPFYRDSVVGLFCTFPIWDFGGKDKLVSLCSLPKSISIPLVMVCWFEDLEVSLRFPTPRVLIEFESQVNFIPC